MLTAAFLPLAAYAQALAWNAPSDSSTGLFLPVGRTDVKADVAPAAKQASVPRRASAVPAAWERRVRIARHELAAARDDVEGAGSGRLLLNVRDGVSLDVVVERTAPTLLGYSLSGRVAGGDVGFVTLVVHEEAVAGTVWTPDAAYELIYVGDGVHVLGDVTNAPPRECAGTLPTELSAQTSRSARTDDGSVVDVLVVWTPAAEGMYGGEPQVLSLIERNIAITNDAFERSGAFISLSLVGAERVEYSETDIFTDLDRLADPDDGHMDRVHDQRDALGADLVYLLASFTGGVAQLGGGFGVGPSAHEFGHNFGLLHERYEPGAGVYGYEHGFTTPRCTATIMSYATVCAGRHTQYGDSPFFASPWRYDLVDGRAVGVSRFTKQRGVLGPAEAVLTLNRNRHTIANLRPSRNGD